MNGSLSRTMQQAGKQYAETGKIDAELLAEIGSPMIPEEEACRHGEWAACEILSVFLLKSAFP